MRDDGGASVALSKLYTVQGFRERADLVDLDEDGIGDAALDALFQECSVGDEQIIADELNVASHLVRHGLPSVPVALCHAVLNRDDRVLLRPGFPVSDHLIA